MPQYDILGLGICAVDDLVYINEYPLPDTKIPVIHRERQCGGLTATALVAASRLGARCAYAGVLGDDEPSGFVLRRLQEENVDTAPAVIRTGAGPVRSIVIVDKTHQTRNIFFDRSGVVGADPLYPPVSLIAAARVLFVDHQGIEGMIRAARIARELNIPVVGDLERDDHPRFHELLGLVDHVVMGAPFALRVSGAAKPEEAAELLYHGSRSAVVITCGEEGAWYRDSSTPEAVHQPAFPAHSVDTTGCGDVFHGVYAALLAEGKPVRQRVLFASAAAAIKATRRGGQAGIPDRRMVEEFLVLRHTG